MISHIHRIFYAMFELELLATVWTIGKARPFSEGIHFEKRTNHITIDPKPEQLFAVWHWKQVQAPAMSQDEAQWVYVWSFLGHQQGLCESWCIVKIAP